MIHNEKQLQISENTNVAIQAATGEYIAFADHDDELTPNALFECVKALNEKKQTRILYSDEDKMSMDGHKFFQPHFKPDYNPDLLCTVNYICHTSFSSRISSRTTTRICSVRSTISAIFSWWTKT